MPLETVALSELCTPTRTQVASSAALLQSNCRFERGMRLPPLHDSRRAFVNQQAAMAAAAAAGYRPPGNAVAHSPIFVILRQPRNIDATFAADCWFLQV